MEVKPSQLIKNAEEIRRAEKALNELYYDNKEKMMILQTCNQHLPKIKKKTHRGQLKILAFSDYRTQRIDELIHFLKHLEEKPDLIIYAGDDVDRFAPLPEKLLREEIQKYFRYTDNLELMSVVISDGRSSYSSRYDYILRLPKNTDEDKAKSRIFEIIEFIDKIYNKLCENKKLLKEDLGELIAKYSTFQLMRKRTEVGITEIVDSSMGTTIIFLREDASGSYSHYLRLGYFDLYESFKLKPSINVKKFGEDRDYSYFHVSVGEPKRNLFEELASYAKYGLLAIIGNDNNFADRFRIYGKKVYEIHNTWIEIGSVLIIGIEGSTCGMGPSGNYSEGSVRLRLELARKFSGDKKLLIVSHSPPRGVLDRAMRFGEASVGSLALRDFLEESKNITLVVCGHVHRCGGKNEKINNATIVNVSSHDDPFSRANLAWIVLDWNGEVKEIKWFKLPSLVETILKEYKGEERSLLLQKEIGLSKNEAITLVIAYHKHGNRLLEDLPELANIKYRYGFWWSSVFKLYDYGVKTPESITKTVYEKILRDSSGLEKIQVEKAYIKILREREKGIYLFSPIPIPDLERIVIFDTEYSGSTGVLYGFLDIESGEFKQFWFDEKPKAKEYLQNKLNKIFVHWGGSDKFILQKDLCFQVSTLDLLYFVQKSLIAPISSATLREVHDVLYGVLEDEFWKHSFYEMDGFYKLMLCNRILREPSDAEAREKLASANKADILALKHIIEKIGQINSGIELKM